MTQNGNEGANMAPKSNGMAVAALVLGIVSIALGWILAGIIGIVTGILAIVLAVLAKKKITADPTVGGKGAATAGLVTGIIGLVMYLAIWIFMAVLVTSTAGALQDLENNQEFKDALNDLGESLESIE
jgi:uncharacterized membrane protein YedE/YeeE